MDPSDTLSAIQVWIKNWGFLTSILISIAIPTMISLVIPHFLGLNCV